MHVCQIQNWKHPNGTALFKISQCHVNHKIWHLYIFMHQSILITCIIILKIKWTINNLNLFKIFWINKLKCIIFSIIIHVFQWCISFKIMTYNNLRKKNKVMEQWRQSPMTEGMNEDIIWITTLVRMVLVHHVHPRMLYFSLKQSIYVNVLTSYIL